VQASARSNRASKWITDVGAAVSTSYLSSVEVACFVVVFGPVLLPLAFLLGLRMAFCFALLFLQVHVQIPPFVKLLALGVVGQVVLSLRFLRAAASRHIAFLRHPITLALGFPPALLLTLFKSGPATADSDGTPLFAQGQTAQILDEARRMEGLGT
jgi:hypothetical protein